MPRKNDTYFHILDLGSAEERQPEAERRERRSHQGHLQAIQIARGPPPLLLLQ